LSIHIEPKVTWPEDEEEESLDALAENSSPIITTRRSSSCLTTDYDDNLQQKIETQILKIATNNKKAVVHLTKEQLTDKILLAIVETPDHMMKEQLFFESDDDDTTRYDECSDLEYEPDLLDSRRRQQVYQSKLPEKRLAEERRGAAIIFKWKRIILETIFVLSLLFVFHMRNDFISVLLLKLSGRDLTVQIGSIIQLFSAAARQS